MKVCHLYVFCLASLISQAFLNHYNARRGERELNSILALCFLCARPHTPEVCKHRSVFQTARKHPPDSSFTSPWARAHAHIQLCQNTRLSNHLHKQWIMRINSWERNQMCIGILASVLKGQQPINTCCCLSLMLIKQQNTTVTKNILCLIYTVNTMQCYFRLNYISVPE